ncbi:polysaccharide deacetylase family protein [candidate division KSB1 bacterium]|nr:polysaccharide deacetylase family protein [candidate division KSB1 bacterium]
MLDKLANQFEELSWMIGGLVRGEYPDFVVRNVEPKKIPAFSYHRVINYEFEQQLRYLKENGYRTITCDEFYEIHQLGNSISEKVVILTFDDGITNFYEVAFPLLQKYQSKAVVFLIGNWIDQPGMVTWEQVRTMHESGLVDFQSHTFNHASIFIEPELIDFIYPGYPAFQNWNVPLTGLNCHDTNFKLPEIGTPIYKFASRISDEVRFFPPDAIQKACLQYVKERGGDNFFKQSNWRKKLRLYGNSQVIKFANERKYESPDEQKEKIHQELVLSKQIIEKNIPGKRVQHLAFPWNQAGKIVQSLLQESGYVSAYGGLSKKYHEKGQDFNIYYINRVSGDFIFCLPGTGRVSFLANIVSKMKRRLTKGVMY